ncbi:Lipopolysaccharide 1,2-glucosyltransferase [Cedecea davisae]|uniref:Glycosyltransferase, family 8 n=1 Tax=Cedecea davisae DSM 4568 TaxID=566551 RepID=S3IFK1_9ENTR|nr:glycosyltransferase [Cedecea davisae]EPF12623.1 glycosyltransferase, family 8 [Cedecea davisae DSM 4568]SUX37036.1 Lipopolysaccharide 1,2-glucosyltransferase [Cedecea davisae]
MTAFNQYINKKDSFSYGAQDIESRPGFHIAYGADVNYQLGAAISIASIAEHNRDSDRYYFFHIFSKSISDQYSSRLNQLAQQFNITIVTYEVDEKVLSALPVNAIWPLSIYYRLLAFDYLSEQVETLLYLDSDIICKGSISELEHLSLGSYYAAVVPDIESTQAKTHHRLGIDFAKKYFNSGFVFANLVIWKQQQLTTRIFKMIQDEKDSGRLKYPDQDALNILLFGNLIYLDKKYNTIYSLKSEFEFKDKLYYKEFISDNTVFIHYTGVTKPWHHWVNYDSALYFQRIYDLSPWSGEDYIVARSKSEYKEEYKHYLYQGRYLKALRSVIAYRRLKQRDRGSL